MRSSQANCWPHIFAPADYLEMRKYLRAEAKKAAPKAKKAMPKGMQAAPKPRAAIAKK
jgi:hypothetical protein